MKFSEKVINMVKLHMLIMNQEEKMLKVFTSEDRQNIMLLLSFIYTSKDRQCRIKEIFSKEEYQLYQDISKVYNQYIKNKHLYLVVDIFRLTPETIINTKSDIKYILLNYDIKRNAELNRANTWMPDFLIDGLYWFYVKAGIVKEVND